MVLFNLPIKPSYQLFLYRRIKSGRKRLRRQRQTQYNPLSLLTRVSTGYSSTIYKTVQCSALSAAPYTVLYCTMQCTVQCYVQYCTAHCTVLFSTVQYNVQRHHRESVSTLHSPTAWRLRLTALRTKCRLEAGRNRKDALEPASHHYVASTHPQVIQRNN